MKKFTIVFSFLMFALLAFGQEYLISDFEGNGAADRTGVWSYSYSGDTLANPVKDGINSSANAVYAPAHYFMPSWAAGWYGTYGGFFCLRGIDPAEYENYTYLRFKQLIMQDNVTTGDSVFNSFKFEIAGGSDNDFETERLIKTEVIEGWGNEWVEHLVELPSELLIGSGLTDVCFIIRNETGEFEPGVGDIDVYIDDIALANGPSVGFEPLDYSKGMAAYMVYDQLKIRMGADANIDAVQVFDIKGSLILNKVINMAGSEISVPLNLNAGIYVVKVKTDGQILTKKFVK